MTEFCRLCAESKDWIEIVTSISDVEQSIEQKLRACCQWTTENTEQRLPHSVCAICLDKLDKCWLFAQSVQLAQQKLQEIFENEAKTNPVGFVQSAYGSTDQSSNLPQAIAFEIDNCNTESSNFQCHICHKIFRSRFLLRVHCTQQPRSKCDICSCEFCTASELDAHCQRGCEGLIETGKNIVNCKPTAVDFNFDDINPIEDSLNANEQTENIGYTSKNDKKKSKKCKNQTEFESKEHKCGQCGRIFSKKSNLLRHHRLIHANNSERDKKAKSVHICEVCSRLCENELGLKLHRRTHTDKHPFKCGECERFFTKKSNLLRHYQQAHSNERPFQCEECGQSFKNKYVLVNHRTRHTDEQPFECWLCHKLFKNRSLLYTHLKIHTVPSEERYKKLRIRRAKKRQQPNGIEYKCMECGEIFSNRLDLREHNRMHDAECSFKCNECNRYFRSKASRRQHRSVHTGEKPYCCPLCDKSFRLRNSLKSHLVSHTQGPTADLKIDDTNSEAQLIQTSGGTSIDLRRLMHKCGDCGRIFPRLSELKEHRATHSNERPFECWLCHRAFKTPRLIKLHLRIHVRPSTYKRNCICELCGKTYRHSLHLNEHFQSAHSDYRPHKCDTCGLGFKTKRLLSSHQKSHTEHQYKCIQCEKSFRHKHSLKHHMEYHTGSIAKPFVCDVCGKGFRINANLVEHRRIHTGEKPFACEHCSSNFRTMSSFYSHLKKIHGVSVSARNREEQIRATLMSQTFTTTD